MTPLRQTADDQSNYEAPRVLPLRPMPEVAAALRSLSLGRAKPAPSFSGVFELVGRAAEAMENAERHARNLRADAIKYFEQIEAELSQARSEAAALRAELEASQAETKNADLRAREAELSARELEATLAATQEKLSVAETELANSHKWLAYFDSELAQRFSNASRALEEMGELSFGASSAKR